ncbi:MAG: hypothetical protein J3K34DRAFT_436932 [Monoraphidium minutum]|nr:MAG: hypothetical protein J3K34DRAFT_436932 [Monoraphidium minutum]
MLWVTLAPWSPLSTISHARCLHITGMPAVHAPFHTAVAVHSCTDGGTATGPCAGATGPTATPRCAACELCRF